MARRTFLRRLFSESLENKRLLSADGHISGEHEHLEAEHGSYDREQPEDTSDDHEYESGDDHGSDDSSPDHMELRANLAGESGAQGEAEYESESEHGRVQQQFEVAIENAEAGSIHDVAIDGVVVGQLTVNGSGRGRLRLSSSPEDNDQPLPADFPAVTAQSVITVGSVAAGSFDGSPVGSSDDNSDDPSNGDPTDDDSSHDNMDDHGGSEQDEQSDASVEWQAALRGDGTAQGRAQFETESEHGAEKQEFSVQLDGAEASATYDVIVDGVTVGQVTTDELGQGFLKLASGDDSYAPLPDDFPTIQAGTAISVGSVVNGTFALDDHSDDASDDHGDDSSSDDSSSDDSSSDDSSSDDSSSDDSQTDSSTELEAVLRGDGTAQGKAEFGLESEHGGLQQEFSVRIAGAELNATYDVMIDGIGVGQLTTNDVGRGYLKLADGDDSQMPLPEGFPAIQPGSTITVGTILSGTFGQDDHRVGDVNDDQQVDDSDIDALQEAIAESSTDDRYDLDGNQSVDRRDANYLIEVVLDSVIGDANMDGIFDSQDLVEIFQAGQYEDGIAGNSTWSTGDWNGDHECDTSDLVYALQRGNYAASAAIRNAAVSLSDIAQATQDDRDRR